MCPSAGQNPNGHSHIICQSHIPYFQINCVCVCVCEYSDSVCVLMVVQDHMMTANDDLPSEYHWSWHETEIPRFLGCTHFLLPLRHCRMDCKIRTIYSAF